MYATVADLRAEGVTEAQASDARLTQLLEEASAFVDHETGWWFEPRPAEFRLSGRRTRSLDVPVPPIELTHVELNGEVLGLGEVLFEGAPVRVPPPESMIIRRVGVFSLGRANVVVRGIFGYTEYDGTPQGRTPLAIRRATMLLAMRLVPLLSDGASVTEVRDRWRVVEERTRDQSVKYAPFAADTVSASALEPELAEILRRYRRPMGLGAV